MALNTIGRETGKGIPGGSTARTTSLGKKMPTKIALEARFTPSG